MRSTAKTDCMKSLIKFKRQEEIIDNTLEHFLDNVKLEPDILRAVKSERFSRMLERRKLENSLRSSILEVKNSLGDVKMSLEEMQQGQMIDVEKFREKLISLANKIRDIKKDSSMEIWTKEESELDEDMREFSQTLGQYENRTSCECQKSRERVVEDFQDYTGAKDFDALIAKTGHTQNWSEQDHLFFLKVRKNSQNVTSMVNAIRKKCPDLTAERIVNHEAWYKVYLDLREKQKRAIREWRETRDSRKREVLEKKIEIDKESLGKGESPRNDESGEKHSETGTIDSKNNVGSEKMREKSRIDKRERIKRWRTDRDSANSLEAAQSRSEMESRRDWEENHRLTRARAIKAAVLTWREKKLENTASSSSASCTDLEEIASRKNATNLLECFRHQDEEFLKRRKAQLQKKNSRSTGISCNKVHSRSSIEKSTLLKPTKVWLEKCKAIKDPDPEVMNRGISYVKYIPKLGSYNCRNRESTRLDILSQPCENLSEDIC